MRKNAAERLKRASRSVLTLPWFSRLKYDGGDPDGAEETATRLTGVLVQNIDEELSEMQYVGKRFAQRLDAFRTAIGDDDADNFERGLEQLGRLLGYKASKPMGQAEPDSVWSLDNQVFFLLEAKSDETPSDTICVSACRQAQGHEKWLRKQPMIPGNAEVFTIVISPRKVLAKEALPHAEKLYYMSVNDVRSLAEASMDTLRSARSKASDLDTEDRINVIMDTINGAGLNQEALKKRLTANVLTQRKTR